MQESMGAISSKGQVTIPVEIRKRLGLYAGNRVLFSLDPDGTVRMKLAEYPTVASLSGAAGTLPQSMSWEEMRAIVREERTAKYEARIE
jgi:AbrB family looped-hinge helix DNA binding protein